jgi:predicted TIM-barrel fold metal-dependent hydrolase
MKIVEAFGADRCVWGSDFPCELWAPGISYSQHLQIFLKDIPFGDQARQRILVRARYPAGSGHTGEQAR